MCIRNIYCSAKRWEPYAFGIHHIFPAPAGKNRCIADNDSVKGRVDKVNYGRKGYRQSTGNRIGCQYKMRYSSPR
jgi:hypothetical protein